MTATIPTVLGQVTVRYLQDADHVAYVNLEKDVEVKRYVNGPSPRSDQDLRDSLRAERPSQGMLAIADTSNDQFIGRCGLLPSKTGNETEVFCLLTKSHWRRGIGELVVPFLVQLASANDKVAVSIIDPENFASLSLVQKLGWVPAGVISEPGKQFGHLRYIQPNATQ